MKKISTISTNLNLKENILINLYITIMSIVSIFIINEIDINPFDYSEKWSILISLSGFVAMSGSYIIYLMTKEKNIFRMIFFYGTIFILFFIYSLILK